MKNSRFQTIFIGVLTAALVIAVLIFSGILPFGKKSANPVGVTGNLTMWGTVQRGYFSGLFEQLAKQNPGLKVSYVEKSAATLDSELINALASGTGPDLILLSQDLLMRYKDKLFVIPYDAYPQRQFTDTFIQEANLFATDEGLLGLPLFVDPMVMYYNRDSIESAGQVNPPRTWKEVADLVPKLTIRDNKGKVLRSITAFGDFDNIPHAKELLSTLLLQTGNPLVVRTGNEFRSTLNVAPNGTQSLPAFDFFMSFAIQTDPLYSWNKTLPTPETMFLSGDMALYLGFASELFTLRNKNPNLNYDVARMPQIAVTGTQITYGKLYGIASLKSSKNLRAAYVVSTIIAGPEFTNTLANGLALPPARRDLLLQKPSNPYATIFYDSALMARGWQDPNPEETKAIFAKIIANRLSGRTQLSTGIVEAQDRLDQLLKPFKIIPTTGNGLK
ncbi:extracellular solute-binding protein [Candidatus Nomurabacteria bacterium]|nr:extracellular solute-binding protein [Candidatus Nomurabacteria bacterium]